MDFSFFEPLHSNKIPLTQSRHLLNVKPQTTISAMAGTSPQLRDSHYINALSATAKAFRKLRRLPATADKDLITATGSKAVDNELPKIARLRTCEPRKWPWPVYP
jgi:hypothetical protein